MVGNLVLAKRIGSIIIFSGICCAGNVELAILSLREKPIQSVRVNAPFLVRVSLRGGSTLPNDLEIDGFSSLTEQGSSDTVEYRRIGNGLYQSHHRLYTVTADQPGSVTLGPARVNGEQSGSLVVEIVERGDDLSEPEVLFTLSKEKVYVGEKVSFMLTVRWQDPDISFPVFEAPDIPGQRLADFRKVRQFKETYKGKDRYVVEYKGDLYPLESGERLIGPLKATYRIESPEQGMFGLFRARSQKHTVRSEPALLMVKPLPECDKKVHAVGSFTEFAATLNSSTTSQHEAVTLVLYLAGEADFTQMKIPMLDLPDQLRSYESKTVPRNDSISWVYVLQGLKEGRYTVPSQKIIYFDTLSHSYKELTTEPLVLTVTPGKPQPTAVVSLSKEEQEEPEVPLRKELFSVPFWLFMVLMAFPPFLFACWWLYAILYPYVRVYFLTRRAKAAILRARKQLEIVTDYTEIYPLLKKALVDYYQMPDASEKVLIAQLARQGVDGQVLKRFVALLFDANRASSFSQTKGDHTLVDRAKEMLSLLGKVLILVLVWCPLQASDVLDSTTNYLGGVPFIVWQLGVIVGWWMLWLSYKRCSSEMLFSLVAVWGIFFGGWALRSRVTYRPRGRVLRSTAMYVGPGETYPIRAALEVNEELVLVKKKGSWYYVNAKNGIGWVEVDSIEKKQE